MKITNPFRLSYCAIILLFGSVNSWTEPHDEPASLKMVDWREAKDPSKLLKWTVDPEHAWWQKTLHHKRQDRPTETPVELPTKCQYVPQNTEKSCADGCICGTQCTGIYIWNNSRPEPRPQYHVCTNWNLNHGNQLRAGFQEAGFQLIPNRTKCGWQKFEGVTALRVGRGSIDVNGTIDQPHGDPFELARIEAVMKQEYPFVEIMIICATLVGPLFLFGGFLSWCFWAGRDRKVKYKRLPKQYS